MHLFDSINNCKKSLGYFLKTFFNSLVFFCNSHKTDISISLPFNYFHYCFMTLRLAIIDELLFTLFIFIYLCNKTIWAMYLDFTCGLEAIKDFKVTTFVLLKQYDFRRDVWVEYTIEYKIFFKNRIINYPFNFLFRCKWFMSKIILYYFLRILIRIFRSIINLFQQTQILRQDVDRGEHA